VATIKDNDSVIFFNFRPDRARQLTRVFCEEDFLGFERNKRISSCFVCFTDYDVTIPNKEVAFHKVEMNNTFGEFLAKNN
jgi:2,3-bisphosphoglycerate-independent phosphoglycerate mutase